MRRILLLLAVIAVTLAVASGVAWALNKVGTNDPDTLRGTKVDDNLLGKGGNDVLWGLAGRDSLLGDEGKDWVIGGNERRILGGEKNLLGGPGNDGVLGGNGSDNLAGGPGNEYVNSWNGFDRVVGEEGNYLLVNGFVRQLSHDKISGGAGNDVIVVNHIPSFEDEVVCGMGFDRVAADTKGVVADDCEGVRIIRTAAQDAAFFVPVFEEALEGLAPFPGNGGGE
jgi:Ca2+-binding RTX toxin-like protein